MRRLAPANRVWLLLSSAALLISGCAVGPSTRPVIGVDQGQPAAATSTSATPRQLPPLDKPNNSTILWQDCTGETKERLGSNGVSDQLTFQCARVVGAVDKNDPTSEPSSLYLLKVGKGPTPLVVINDADGLPGTLYAATLANKLPGDLLNTFSLIGVDRRGTGKSDPVHCIPLQLRIQIVGFDPTSSQLDSLVNSTKSASEQCAISLDQKLTTINSTNAATDLEQIRKQLGVSTLDAIGHGEGSRVLTLYADSHPNQVGRFVLDGSPDPSLDTLGQAEAKAVGAEATFTAFAADCVARRCGLAPDPKQAVLGLLDQLRSQPKITSNNLIMNPGTALHAVLAGLADRSRWSALGDALAAARSGSVDGLADFVGPLFFGTDTLPGISPSFDAGLVTTCNDIKERLSPQQISATIKDWDTKYPLFGGFMAQQVLPCSSWAIPGNALPTPQGKNTPPLLVISTAADPITPEPSTQRTARQLTSGVLLSWQGAGHGALPQSSCATAAAQHFLVDAQVPDNNTACPP